MDHVELTPSANPAPTKSVTTPLPSGITLGRMPNSDSSSSDKEKTFAQKVGIAVLKGSITAAVAYVLGPVAAAITPKTIDSIASAIGFVQGAFVKVVESTTAEHLSGAAEKALAGSAPSKPFSVQLDKPIERLLTRSAAQTILTLLREWQRLEDRQKPGTALIAELHALDTACAAYLADSSDTEKPAALAPWLAALERAEFLDRPELGIAPWNRQQAGKPPEHPCDFAAWFQWRYCDQFQKHFADEYPRDPAARDQFTLLIARRMLELHLEGLDKLDAILALLKPVVHSETWEKQVEAYEFHSTRDFETLKIAALGGTSDAEAAISLSGLYVDPAAETAVFRYLSPGMDAQYSGTIRTTSRSDSILTAIRSTEYPRHIILGGAGMGKSSVLRCLYLSWALRDSASGARLRAIIAGASRPQASHESGDPKEGERLVPQGSEGARESLELSGNHSVVQGDGTSPLLEAQRLADDGGGTPPLPVPILVEIREFLGARGRAVDGVDHKPVEDIIDYLTQNCGRAWCFDRAALLAALDEGRAWLLVDGLDEAFDPAERKRVGDWLRSFSFQHPKARIIASSRVIGFVEHEWARRGVDDGEPTWEMHTLCPFDEGRIGTFLDQWFRAEGTGTFVRATKREEVAKAIASRPFLKPLAEVPLTLTMICAVGQRGIQPENRHAVFFEAAKIFIQQWDNARGLPRDKIRIVERWREYGESGRMAFFRSVAMKMVEGGNPNDSNRISRDDLRAVLVKKFTDGKESNPESLADDILNLICERNFLLTELGGDAYAFFHRAFLEYFTALGWADRFQNSGYEDPAGEKPAFRMFFEKVIRPRVADGTWHDTLRFLFGVLPTVPAQRCLQALWAMKAEQLPRTKELGLSKKEDRIWVARVLAAELAAEVRPYSPEDGESISPQSIAKAWRRELAGFAVMDRMWVMEEASLRDRAMMAVAVLWAGDEAAGMELARLLLPLEGRAAAADALGRALAAGWPGLSWVYALVRDVALGADAAKVVSDFSRHGVQSGETVHPSRQEGLSENGPALTSEGLPTKVVDYVAARTSPDVLAPFFEVEFRDQVRLRAVYALATGWPAEPEVRAVITAFAQGASVNATVREIAKDCIRHILS